MSLDRALLEQQMAQLPIVQYEFFPTSQLVFSEKVRAICKSNCPRPPQFLPAVRWRNPLAAVWPLAPRVPAERTPAKKRQSRRNSSRLPP